MKPVTVSVSMSIVYSLSIDLCAFESHDSALTVAVPSLYDAAFTQSPGLRRLYKFIILIVFFVALSISKRFLIAKSELCLIVPQSFT